MAKRMSQMSKIYELNKPVFYFGISQRFKFRRHENMQLNLCEFFWFSSVFLAFKSNSKGTAK